MTSIAIVGMGGRFAGAPDLHAYWDLTVSGRNAFGPVPPDRWPDEMFFDANRRATDKSYAPAGAFIDDVRTFPALHFGIPPRRVEVMDPQHRLSLEVSLQAIEDAGYHPRQLPRRTGVFVGVTAAEFRVLVSSRVSAALMAAGVMGQPGADPKVFARAIERVVPSRPFSAAGALSNMTAAAVAQELDLHGPAYTLDAACASALMALSDAVAQLRAGSVDAALAGGVYLQLSPENYIAFSRIGAISGSGVCRPFDARADGFVQGDGAGMVLLKRLDDARADGDRIYAVIHGIATNNDGRGDGPMAPLVAGQVEVIRDAWADAGRDPAELGYVEAHGTGTDVGDQIELSGLHQALGDRARHVWVGSSKANVGHTMSAAGIAGVLRAALAIHHRTVPPMAGFASAKPEVRLDGHPFAVPTAAVPWDGPGLAAVSSFGFGGTNGHVVLGPPPAREPAASAQPELVLFSAPSEEGVRVTARRMAAALRADPQIDVASASRAWATRPGLAHRAAVVAADRDGLLGQLDAIGRGEHPKGSAAGVARGAPPKVALLFPGQGAQRVGMLAGVRDRFPVVARALEQAERDLSDLLPLPLSHLLYPERRATPVDAATAEAELTFTANCQPALVAAGVALWRLLEAVGVKVTVAGGHSLGEFAASVVGGVLSDRDAVRFAAMRGRAMADRPGDPGTMAALLAGVEQVRPLLVDGAVIANENHPTQVVVSGRREAVAQVTERAAAAGIEAKPLNVSHGFHSPVFDGLDPEPWLKAIEVRAPGAVTVASGISPNPYADRDDALAVFRRHASSPVRFGRLIEQCAEAGADLYLQVGAGGPLASFARKGAGHDARAVLTLASTDDTDGGRSALEALGWLWVNGVALDPRPITGAAAVASVPPITLPREPYWPVKDEVQLGLDLPGTAPRAVARPTEPADAEPTAPAPGLDEVFEKVAAVVAKVSSYPRAAIRPDVSLTDELGFDSLMVADLANGLAEAFPGLGGLPQELLLNRPTVSAIVEHVRVAATGGAAGPDDDDALVAYAPRWIPCPLPEVHPPPPGALTGQTVLVIGDRDDEVIAALKHAGAQVTRRAKAPVQGIVVVGSFLDPVPVSAVYAGEASPPDRAGALLALLDEQVRLGGAPSVVVMARADDAWAEGEAGVVRSVAREWPEGVAKTVWFDQVQPAFRAARLVQELVSVDRSVDVRWDHDGRSISGQAPVTFEPRWTPGPGDRVLITGGTRGIGASLAARLVAAGVSVVLVGRGEPDAAVRALPADRVTVVASDVTDRVALHRDVGPLGPFTAVVHCAGVLADGPLGKVDAATGERARRVKVDGFANALTAASARGAPGIALAVGSWAGRFGNRHQAHYAAANAALAAFATHPPKGTRIVLAEFGPWSSSEMVQTIPRAVQAAMRAEGVDFVGDEAGLGALWADLTGGAGVVVHGRRLPWWNRVRVFTDTLSTETHPYLSDHAIDGVPVLPLASATDLCAWVAGVPHPYEVRDLRLYAGVAVKEPLKIKVVVRGERVELRMGERDTLAYRATVAPVDPASVALPTPVTGGAPLGLTVDAFYGGVTFHGRTFHGVVAVDGVGDGVLRGRVRASKVSEWMPKLDRAHWSVDPLALDSAFQLGAMVAWDRYHRGGTPVALGRMVVLAPFPAGTIHVDGTFGPPDGDRSVGSFVLRDAEGKAFAWAVDAVAELKKAEGAPSFEIKREWIDPTTWPELKDLDQRLEAATMLGIPNPYFHVHEGTARDTTVVGGRTLVNFSSYNYLGFSGDPRVLDQVDVAVRKYGTSVSASRVASGERPYHRELERELAAAQGVDDALVFTAGHMTNVNAIATVMKPADLVLHDELIHESLHQGIKMSGAGRRGFRHDEPAHLEKLLSELRPHHEKCLIVVEGVYSMDGDLCALPEYVRLKEKYGCLLMVDEAHSFGVCGSTGRGIGEHFRETAGFDPRSVDLWMGTLSKSLASCGGWIGGSAAMIRLLRYGAGGFVYSAGITPANGTAALASLRLMLEEPWRVTRLQANAKLFHDALVARGVDTGPAKGGSAVVPAVTGNSMHALLLSQRLREQGVNVQPIIYPAVADNAARLRFFLSSTHSEAQLVDTAERVAATLAQIRKEFPA
ncbi:MAG: aminotransferase class I/II-fold pyridoxal phosphate-dependent enzyme [Myxococcota bacterium]